MGQRLPAGGLVAHGLEEQQRKAGEKERLARLAGLADRLGQRCVEPVA
jgi:hypothetical protein